MKGRDGPIGRAKLLTRDFRRNVIRGIELCILIYIVLWIQSLIFTPLMFSLKYKLKLKTSWSSIFRKLQLQVNLSFNLLELQESLIFQVFNLSEDDDLGVDKNLNVLRVFLKFKSSILHSFNFLELQFFKASIFQSFNSSFNQRSVK